jgi:agmatine deiminase
MAWPAFASIWSSELLPKVRADIVKIAKTIAKYEPVVLIANPHQEESARQAFSSSEDSQNNITVLSLPLDDLWARDTLPVFLEWINNNETSDVNNINLSVIVGVNFNFNGWGGKQQHGNDSTLAKKVIKHYSLECLQAPLIAEGGSFETDGDGTLLVTESSIVNENRNKGKSRDELEAELKDYLGIKKVIWFPGVKGRDITDAHVDCLARFASPGVVVLNRPWKNSTEDEDDVWTVSSNEAKAIVENSTDALGNKIKVVELYEPDPKKISYQEDEEESTQSTFLASYVNYYVANGVVIMPTFGDEEADRAAMKIVKGLYPGREVVGIEVNTLASGGGGIHCSTHDQPL